MANETARRERHDRAALLLSGGRVEEAIRIYRELQAEAPRDLKALAALRDLYTRLGRTAELADQWWLLAEVRADAGNYLDAQFALQRATTLDARAEGCGAELRARPGDAPSPRRRVFREAARAYFQSGSHEALWRVLQRVEELAEDPYARIREYAERLERHPGDAAAAKGLDEVFRYLGWSTHAADRAAAAVRASLRERGIVPGAGARLVVH